MKTLVLIVLLLSGQAHAQNPSSPNAIWCGNVVRELTRVLELAEIEESQGSFTKAGQTLMTGLKNTNANQYLRTGPMTARAIYRAIELGQIMQRTVAGNSNAPRSNVEFLSQYYQFIIYTANSLDIPYYIPNLDCHRCNTGFEMQAFETNYLQFAKSEIQTVLNSLTVNNGYGQVFPVGSTAAFLNILSRSIQYAISDLEESPFVASYACAMGSLSQLNALIAQGGLSNEPDTVNYVSQKTQSALSELQAPGRCGYYP